VSAPAAIDGRPGEAPPAPAIDARALMERAGGENFPVALRALSRSDRRRLLAVYGFARLADELGDSHTGERLAALDWLDRELDRAYAGRSTTPLLQSLQPTLRELALPREPFARLIEANRLDQTVKRYETWEQLLGYCELSANPVGELVLHIFDMAEARNVELSDRICTALQLAEHWQDVREDALAGRVYLPAEDLARFSLEPRDLLESAGDPPAELRRRTSEAIAFQARRTRELLEQGAPLLRSASGRRKLALAAFLAGGLAALGALERAGFDVLTPTPPRAGRLLRAAALARALAGGRP
jgi:squalene synthase HpnC